MEGAQCLIQVLAAWFVALSSKALFPGRSIIWTLALRCVAFSVHLQALTSKARAARETWRLRKRPPA